ncbi:MAG: hypothetical protein U0930_06425 [Pirellulales bacterium]
MKEIGQSKGLSVRVWTPTPPGRKKAKLAICTTYQESTPRVLLEAMQAGSLNAEPTVMIGNRKRCESLAKQYNVPFHNIGDREGNSDEQAMVDLLDHYDDYIILGAVHASPSTGHMLEVCRRSHH